MPTDRPARGGGANRKDGQHQEGTIPVAGGYGIRRAEGEGRGQQRRGDNRARNDVRLPGPDCGLPRNPYDAPVRTSDSRRDTLAAAAKPDVRRDGRTAPPHRDNGAMRNRCRCRRSVYGNASEPGGGEVGRGKHAAARPHGGTARTAVGAAHGCKRNKPLMGRILAIDYGRKRTGIAVTDTLQIVANGLTTVPTHQLLTFLKQYVAKEPVERIVVGLPKQMNNEPSESMRYIKPFLAQLAKEMPQMPVEMYDERFTSVIAHRAMLDGGMKKTARRDKAIVDEISATIILNDFLESRYKNYFQDPLITASYYCPKSLFLK